MEREWLQRKLQRHESVQAIAVSAGRHPATVAYWINKHGLCSPLRAKHASRGGIAHTELQSLVEQGLSIREIAAVCGFSASSIRYWLRRHGLRTRPSRYMHGESKPYEILRECRCWRRPAAHVGCAATTAIPERSSFTIWIHERKGFTSPNGA